MEPVKYNPNRKFMYDMGRAVAAILVLILLGIAPVVVIAVWRALL